jgi:hypothetical protein
MLPVTVRTGELHRTMYTNPSTMPFLLYNKKMYILHKYGSISRNEMATKVNIHWPNDAQLRISHNPES